MRGFITEWHLPLIVASFGWQVGARVMGALARGERPTFLSLAFEVPALPAHRVRRALPVVYHCHDGRPWANCEP